MRGLSTAILCLLALILAFAFASGAKPQRGNVGVPNCRYKRPQFGECDAVTNKQTATVTLKKGGPECAPTKVESRDCKKKCKYEKGTFSPCVGGKKTRVDRLKAGSDAGCAPQLSINKNCKSVTNCRYSKTGAWSACNGGQKTRTLTLKNGPATCEPTKVTHKKC